MIVTWADVGRTETPCWVTLEGKRVRIEQRHIDAWKEDPSGVWTLQEFSCCNSTTQWVLRRFYRGVQR
jgi:hypothetical protein